MRYLFLTLFLCCTAIVHAQVNLNSGLVAYYPFNGNANDASGNNINGTVTNATLTTDQSGNANSAYYFDGSTGYIQLPYSSLYNFAANDSFSLATWILPDNNQAYPYQAVVVKSPYNFNYYLSSWNYGLYLANYKGMSGYANNNFLVGTSTLNPNQCWHHLAVTYKNGNWNLYVDGVLEAYDYSQTKFILQDASSAICFGKKGEAFGDWYKGKMDEVRIYHRVLNLQEIDSLSTRAVSCDTTIINKYAAVLSRQGCDNIITVDTATGFNVGDTILMIQMKGAVIDSTNTAAFGTVTDYRGAGNYEYNVIKAKSGNNITLKYKIVRDYNIPDGKVQIVRVPYYQNYTVNQTHTCMPWTGTKGGVFVVNVANTLTMNGNIDVSGKGFKGGQINNGTTYTCNQTDYFYPLSGNDGGQKGEGIAELSNAKMRGRGRLANGGGGGNNTNAGGGGGGNAGIGGNGGHQWQNCDTSLAMGGYGGIGLTYNTTANKIFFGGGGGAGHENNADTDPAGDGGGIVIINASTISGSAHLIKANGTSCIDNNSLSGNGDGQSGGGAGGTILLKAGTISSSPLVEAKGGNGGNVYASVIHGPGAGGSGGAVLFAGTATVPAGSINVNGGINGTVVSVNIPHDAQPGQSGQTLTGLQLNFPVDTFKPNQILVNFTDSVISCYTRKFKDLTITTTTGAASWNWKFPNGGSSTQQNPTFTFPGYGNYPVTLVVTDSNGCKDSVTKNINIPYVHFAKAGNDTTTCYGGTVTLHASGGVSYAWSPASGVNSPNAATTVATPAAAGDYIVTVTNAAGCVDMDTVHVSLVQGAFITAVPDQASACNGKTVNLNATGGVSYTWSPSTGLSNPNIANPTATVNGNQQYIVSGTAANGCTATDTVEVTEIPGPAVSITSDGNSISCYNRSVQLYAHGALSYRWEPAQYCNNATIPSPSVTPPVTTTFTVTGTDASGCTGRDTITILSYKDVAIYMPNAFTPNGDGLNDDIKPMVFCDFVFEQFLVFDRWGENVFTSYNLNNGWDGNYKGSPAMLGVYHYLVKGRKSDGTPAMIKGNFTLLR